MGTRPVSVIGLGGMGSDMARALIDAGYPVTVYDRSAEAAAHGVRLPLVEASADRFAEVISAGGPTRTRPWWPSSWPVRNPHPASNQPRNRGGVLVMIDILAVLVVVTSGVIAGVLFGVAVSVLPAFFAMPPDRYIYSTKLIGRSGPDDADHRGHLDGVDILLAILGPHGATFTLFVAASVLPVGVSVVSHWCNVPICARCGDRRGRVERDRPRHRVTTGWPDTKPATGSSRPAGPWWAGQQAGLVVFAANGDLVGVVSSLPGFRAPSITGGGRIRPTAIRHGPSARPAGSPGRTRHPRLVASSHRSVLTIPVQRRYSRPQRPVY